MTSSHDSVTTCDNLAVGGPGDRVCECALVGRVGSSHQQDLAGDSQALPCPLSSSRRIESAIPKPRPRQQRPSMARMSCFRSGLLSDSRRPPQQELPSDLPCKVVVGMDTRPTSAHLCSLVKSGAAVCGADCEDVGLSTTPQVENTGRVPARAHMRTLCTHECIHIQKCPLFECVRACDPCIYVRIRAMIRMAYDQRMSVHVRIQD
jgi:hypothetical protein